MKGVQRKLEETREDNSEIDNEPLFDVVISLLRGGGLIFQAAILRRGRRGST